MENTEEENLLGVVIDKQLNFETHITKLCQKAGNKLFALARISKYMNSDKLRILMRCFVISQFQYCPLAWMFHSRHLNNEINKIHEKAQRIAYKDYESSFSTLVGRDTYVTINTKNLQILLLPRLLLGATELRRILRRVAKISKCLGKTEHGVHEQLHCFG